ncbi:MAG: acyltransferase family protein, partial [Thermosynechococcaceae cyanobacterium]
MITSSKEVAARTQSRSEHIDIAKGIGILIVVLGHNWLTLNQKGELFNILFSVSMPLFFFLSGIFFNPSRSLLDTTATKIDTLLRPYFVTLTLIGISDLLLEGGSFPKYMSGVLYGTG